MLTKIKFISMISVIFCLAPNKRQYYCYKLLIQLKTSDPM